MRRGIAYLLLAFAALGVGSARARLVDIDAATRGTKELLYLPNGKHSKAMSLGYAPLVADFVYLWAIQYYSDYDRQDRYRYVEHVFGNVIAELDPAYTDPYWLGAIILTTEAKDVDAGLRLLDKGFVKNPSSWILPYLAGWECDRVGQFDRAAAYFDLAAKVPGAPPALFRLKAGMTALTGNLREAIARWQDVLDDPRNDDGARVIATRQIRTLTVRADVQDLEAGIAAYRERYGRPPRSLNDLVRDGVVRALPRDPEGKDYVYDASARDGVEHRVEGARLMSAMPIEPFASIVVLAVGLVLGSFLNVCIYRLPLGESVVYPGSRCPKCGAAVRAWQNVPVISWLALRGRCAACRAPISWRYPAVEALTGIAAVALWRGFGPSFAFAIATVFTFMMIVLFFTDYDHQLLPDLVTLPGFAVGLAVAWYNPFLGDPGWPRIVASLTGAALGSGILWSIGAIYSRLRGVEAMGFGDVKMMACVGAFTGPAGVAVTLFAASIVGAVTGLALIPLKGKTLQNALPFGCFLAPAALGALLWGRRAVAAYLGLLHLPS